MTDVIHSGARVAAIATVSELRAFQAAAAGRESGSRFLGLPERWMDRPRWRCQRGHVGTCYVRCEVGGDRCMACGAHVVLTFPEDSEQP